MERLVEVDLADVAEVFKLSREGVDALSKLELSVEVEFARFAANKNAEWKVKGSNMRTDLEKPFNLICELYTKSVVCNIGTLGQVSDSKIFAVSAIVDNLSGTKFNWHDWFINQIHDTAKEFEFQKGSTVDIVRKGKLRFFAKLSYALEQMFPERNWTGTKEYKKSSIFYDLYKTDKIIVDRGILQKEVRPAVPTAERQGKKLKRAASPVKRASPKRRKVKRVASLVEASEEEEEHPLEEVEVDQPQASPTHIQIQPTPTQATQEPQLEASTTAQPQSQPQASEHSLYQEKSASSIPIPKIPFLHTDPDAAFTLFEPTQTTHQTPTQIA